MKKSSAIILLTTAGFASGLGAGLWIGRNYVPPPPPPAWLFSEFRGITNPGSTLQSMVQARPDLWREINAELQTMKSQIDDFRGSLLKIDGEFREDFEAILTEEQKLKLAEAQKRRELPRIFAPAPAPKPIAPVAQTDKKPAPASTAAQPPASPVPATSNTAPAAQTTTAAKTPPPQAQPDKAPRLYQDSADGFVASLVFNSFTQERFTQVLGLSQTQEDRLRQLLNTRRERFLQLSDETPPPSLQLSRIAGIIRKAEQKK